MERCRDDINTNGVGGCNATLNIICIAGTIGNGNGGAIAGDLFADPLCTSSTFFDDELVNACKEDTTDTGKFSTCPDLLSNLCPNSGDRNANCPPRTLTDNVVDFARWIIQPVAANGTEELTVLSEVGNDDPLVSYVEAGKITINRGVVLNPNGSPRGGFDAVSLTLESFDRQLFDKTSGFSIERLAYTGFTGDFLSIGGVGNAKYYAGILSTTDVGAPLTAENSTEAIWDAKFSLINHHNNRHLVNRTAGDFSLEVNFGDKTIKTRAADAVRLDFGGIIGNIIIDGEFTDVGVIYGKSELVLTGSGVTGGRAVSNGSLTGLIGVGGAVGVFISDGDVKDAGPYVGGFVARNPQPCLDTPFAGHCRETPGIFLARANMCNENMEVNGVDGCNDTIVDVCSDTDGSGSAINPFHGICGTDDTYEASRSLSCANNRNGYVDTAGDNCMIRTTRICDTEGDLLDAICTEGKYTERREALCAGDSIETSLMIARCEPIITALCTVEPFNTAVGGFAVKFDCTASDNYDAARQARITLCLNSETNNTPLCEQPGVMATTELCADDPFDMRCDDYAVQYETARMNRLELCRGDAAMRGATLCANAAVRVCDATDSPFATVCGPNDGINNAEQRVVFCKDNVADGNCPPTITAFCDRALGADLFLNICYTEATATAFIDNRVAACQTANANTEVHADCEMLVETRCPETGLRSPACVTAGTLPTSVWVYKAQNADGGRLEILDEVGLDDAYTNYVQGNATGLNLGALLEGGVRKDGVVGSETVLSINHLDNVDARAEGSVAFTSISYASLTESFTQNPVGSRRRYYAGLLNNVDLGGPLTDGSADGIWNARVYATISEAVQIDIETSLIVNFDAKTIKTRDVDDDYGLADPVTLSGGAGSIVIAGEFTDAGVIFGTSSWIFGNRTSAGTVTGLIGKYGAIGAFVSDGKNSSDDVRAEYAGGFVAAPVDCEVTGNPFYRLCDASIDKVMMAQKAVCDADVENAFDPRCAPYVTEGQKGMFCDADAMRAFDPICAPYTEPEEKTAFAEICRMEPLTTGCDRVIADTPRLTINDCTDSDTGNPYQAGCGVDFGDVFNAERTARTLTCKGNDVYNASQCSEVLGNCFGSVSAMGCDTVIKLACDTNLDGRCAGEVPNICADPFNIICENDYAEARQRECMGQDIATPSDGRCAPVIAALCGLDPFATAAGPEGSTFDCTEGDTYLGARQSACAGQDIADPSDGRCVSILSTLCTANPFNNAAGVGAMTIDCTVGDTYKTARETACTANINADGNSCVTVFTTIETNECIRSPGRLACDAKVREPACPGFPTRNDLTCAAVIAARCRLDPLNSRAGVGDKKYDCANYRVLPNYDPNNVTPFVKMQQDALVESIRAEFEALREARVALCKNPANSEDPLCLVPTTLAFITTCASNPFDTRCECFWRSIRDRKSQSDSELSYGCFPS